MTYPQYTFELTSRAQLAALSFDQLASLRSCIDSDLNHLLNHLHNSLSADMETPLLTLDGYPRNDIDVPEIRKCRSKIITLRNDYKWISEELLEKMNTQLEKNKQ
ncbi:hypothetical protein CANINC_004754 [Pichia inconspicua]|uniref:Nas2 N-terminal domain-containing protein n=1 Tax=Pichia inconspicua TaxID=52247 RepID=A0A4V4NF45_9ASCO|nr:hypothetical protein CANINC_004754 [[Candida] inconspicua]